MLRNAQLHGRGLAMKTLGLSIVVALGLVLGLWWTREASVSRPAVDQAAEPPPRARRAIGPSNAAMRPLVELAKRERPTLEPIEVDPKRRKAQEALWQELRGFASEAELTDAQWDRFERDLSELAEIEATAWAKALKAENFEGVIELSQELGHELEVRAAAYMTKKQQSILRFRLNAGGVVTRVRQLHFVPFMTRLLLEPE